MTYHDHTIGEAAGVVEIAGCCGHGHGQQPQSAMHSASGSRAYIKFRVSTAF